MTGDVVCVNFMNEEIDRSHCQGRLGNAPAPLSKTCVVDCPPPPPPPPTITPDPEPQPEPDVVVPTTPTTPTTVECNYIKTRCGTNNTKQDSGDSCQQVIDTARNICMTKTLNVNPAPEYEREFRVENQFTTNKCYVTSYCSTMYKCTRKSCTNGTGGTRAGWSDGW